MSTPAQNTMEVNTPASIAAFRTKSAADKILSYMWYIHVLVSVNTETRLRAKTALVLKQHCVLSVPTSPEDTFIDQPSEPGTQDQQQQQQQQPSHDLTDHLILGLFDHNILARLVDTAPVFAQANGYARILAEVPEPFREEFCRRLYTLLFSKHIVEWPQGIDVPEPVIAAAKPIIVVDIPVESEEDTHLSPEHEQEEIGGAGLDGIMEDKDDDFGSPGSSLRPSASIWLQTPSCSSWDGDDITHMERAAYFGTVSNPLPMNYFADWEWSRNGSGPQNTVNEHDMSCDQLKVPFPSPQKQDRKTSGVLQTPPCNTNHDEPPFPPHAHRQGRGKPSAMYGDDIGNHGCEISRWPLSLITGSGLCRLGRGRMGPGHEQRNSELGWDEGSPAVCTSELPGHSRPSSLIPGFPPSAEQAEARQLTRGA